jgi:hypothetical protein
MRREHRSDPPAVADPSRSDLRRDRLFRDRISSLQEPGAREQSVITGIARRHGLPVETVVSWLIEQWACHPLRLLAQP